MKKIIMVFVLLFLLDFGSAAFGVDAPCDESDCYWEDRPLVVSPGETRELSFGLQNSGEEDIKLKAVLAEGFDVATLVEDIEYIVAPGSEDVKIKVTIEIPQEARFGDRYDVRIIVREAPSAEGGNVELATSIRVSLPIVIEGDLSPESEEKFSLWPLAILVGALIVVLVTLVYVLRRKDYSTYEEIGRE